MNEPTTDAVCARCALPLGEPYAHCGNCRADYCLACGSQHFCKPSCRANGCIAGLCVRLVINGELSQEWGVPKELRYQAAEGYE